MWFYVPGYRKAHLAGVLVLNTSQKTGPQLKDSSDRRRGSNSEPLGTRRVTYPLHHGSSFLEVGLVYVF